MKDAIGVGTLYLGYIVIALVQWLLGVPFDRALMFVILFAVAQSRWFQRDVSPL